MIDENFYLLFSKTLKDIWKVFETQFKKKREMKMLIFNE